MPRVLLIGWDGADWRILDPLLERGDLPNLHALIDRGQKGVLRSTVPTHSWAAWPSFLTGVDPADHGVYDILETVPGTHKQYPVTYKSIKERTFVEDLSAAGKVGRLCRRAADVPDAGDRGEDRRRWACCRRAVRTRTRPTCPSSSRTPACRGRSTGCRGRRSATSPTRTSTRRSRSPVSGSARPSG